MLSEILAVGSLKKEIKTKMSSHPEFFEPVPVITEAMKCHQTVIDDDKENVEPLPKKRFPVELLEADKIVRNEQFSSSPLLCLPKLYYEKFIKRGETEFQITIHNFDFFEVFHGDLTLNVEFEDRLFPFLLDVPCDDENTSTCGLWELKLGSAQENNEIGVAYNILRKIVLGVPRIDFEFKRLVVIVKNTKQDDDLLEDLVFYIYNNKGSKYDVTVHLS
jgi:hypothetical protein